MYVVCMCLLTSARLRSSRSRGGGFCLCEGGEAMAAGDDTALCPGGTNRVSSSFSSSCCCCCCCPPLSLAMSSVFLAQAPAPCRARLARGGGGSTGVRKRECNHCRTCSRTCWFRKSPCMAITPSGGGAGSRSMPRICPPGRVSEYAT